MPRFFYPVDNKNINNHGKPFEKMMKKIVDGNFSRKGWSRDRKDALEDIMIDYVPAYLADKQQKRRGAEHKAAQTRRERKAVKPTNWHIEWFSLQYWAIIHNKDRDVAEPTEKQESEKITRREDLNDDPRWTSGMLASLTR